MLGEHGIEKNSPVGRKGVERRMEWRRVSEEEVTPLEPGWYIGSEEFRKELLAQMKGRAKDFGDEIRRSGERKALKSIQTELRKLGWTDEDLLERAKGEAAAKIQIAKILREETTMTLGWIAAAKTHLSHLLCWHGKEKKKPRK